MIKSLDELKILIEWCRSRKIKKLEIGDIKFEISELDFIPEESQQKSNVGKYNTETLVDTLNQSSQSSEDEDLLYWSTK